MDLLSHLTSLDAADLDEVVAHRPEAVHFRDRPRSRLPALAALLGTHHGIYLAASRLDRFHHQLLQLACIFDGRLEPGLAADQGVPAGTFAPAARELAHRALAFPHEGRLDVPAEVQEVITYFGVGLPLRRVVAAENADELKRIAPAIGAPGTRKAELVDGIVRRLSDPACVRSLLQHAPPASLRALDAIRGAGRGATIGGLADELGRSSVYRFREQYYRRQRTVDESGLSWLWDRGLIFKESWEGLIGVPAPVEVAIRGRAFPSWETAPPELDLAPVALDRSPLAIVEEMSRLLINLARTEMALLKSGDIGVKECRRIASEVGSDEHAVRRLLTIGHHAGLLDVRSESSRPRSRRRGAPPDETHTMLVADAGRRWLAAEPAAAWLTVARGWRRAVGTGALQANTPGFDAAEVVLKALAELPSGTGATPASLGRRLSWLMPAVWEDDGSATAAVTEMQSLLADLGVSPTSGPVALSELGRAVMADGKEAEIRQLLPAGTERCTVQADMTIIVSGPPSVALGTGLGRIADLLSSGAARVYRLNEQSIRRGLDQGMTAEEIEDFLVAHSDVELPGPVRELVRDLGRRHGRVRVGTAAVYISGEDAAALAEALASSKVRGLGARLIAPTVAVIEGRTQAQVVEALRSAGLMPAVERPAAEPATPVEAPSPARRARGADPEVLERRREALARARAARAEKLKAARG